MIKRKIIVTLFPILVFSADLPQLTLEVNNPWDSSISKDEMTGDLSAYASSCVIRPTKRMARVFTNTPCLDSPASWRVSLYVMCRK